MEGVVDETELKERIVVTGAEVSIIFPFHHMNVLCAHS